MKKILIVDSDTQLSTILTMKLRHRGYEVKALTSVINAIQEVSSFRPSLIISEMILPEMSGVDFLKRLKLNPKTSNIPFMFLSSSRNVEDKILAHEMGAEAFFAKPIFLKVLINRIEDFFEQREFEQILTGNILDNRFEGKLIDINLIDLLNIISENNHSGDIEVVSGSGAKGRIYFKATSVVRVEIDGAVHQTGEDLLLSMLAWIDGSFVITYHDISVVHNVETPMEKLIDMCVHWLRDFTANLGELPSLDTAVYLDFGALVGNLNRIPDNAGTVVKHIPYAGIRLGDLIAITKGDRKVVSEYLRHLFQLSILRKEQTDSPVVLPKVPDWLKKTSEGIPSPISSESDPVPMELEPAEDKDVTAPMQPHFMTLDRWEEDEPNTEKADAQSAQNKAVSDDQQKQHVSAAEESVSSHIMTEEELDAIFKEERSSVVPIIIIIVVLLLIIFVLIYFFFLRGGIA